MEVYLRIMSLLRDYFNENTEALFLGGGCFYLAEFLHERIRSSDIYVNRYQEHCATRIGTFGLYDITGKISDCNFHFASNREIAFMKKNYIPKFDQKSVSQYLDECLKKQRGVV